MASRIVRPERGERRTAIPRVIAQQIARNGLFSMTRSESGAQLNGRTEKGQEVQFACLSPYPQMAGNEGEIDELGYFLWWPARRFLS